MMEDNTPLVASFDQRLFWMTDDLRPWAVTSPFIQLALEQAFTGRDLRLSGSPTSNRTRTALITAMALQHAPETTGSTLIVAASAQLHDLVLAELQTLLADHPLSVQSLSPRRITQSQIETICQGNFEVLVSTYAGLERLMESESFPKEQIRRLLICDGDWLAQQVSIKKVERTLNSLPSACQRLLITLPPTENNLGLTQWLRAPSLHRIPDEKTYNITCHESALVLEAQDLLTHLSEHPLPSQTLIVGGSNTQLQTLASAFTQLGQSSKVLSESEPSPTLEAFKDGELTACLREDIAIRETPCKAKHVFYIRLPGGAEAYLALHQNLLDAEDPQNSFTLIITPKELPALHQLLVQCNRRVALRNPLNYDGLPDYIGQTTHRERLTIRTPAPAVSQESDDATTESKEAMPDSHNPSTERLAPGKSNRSGRKSSKSKRFPLNRNLRKKPSKDSHTPSSSVSEKSPDDSPETHEGGEKKPRHFSKKRFAGNPKKSRPVSNATKTSTPETPSEGKESTEKKPRPNKKSRAFRTHEPDGTQNKQDTRFSKNTKSLKKRRPPRPKIDEDNFGNSIYYQPKRQNLRTLRSDQPIHWEPNDPFHPASQALSLPQMMPDEYPSRSHHRNANGNKRFNKTGFNKKNRSRKPNPRGNG